MKTNQTILTTLLISIAILTTTARAGLILNGNLESFTSGQPDSWTYFETPDRSLQTVESSMHVSPFTTVYPASTRSALLTDTALSNLRPSMTQLFPVQTSLLNFSFDFFVSDDAFSAQPWSVSLENNRFGLPFGGDAALNFYIDFPGGGIFRAGGQNGDFATPIVLGTWYHVHALVDIAQSEYVGSIQPFGGSPVSWSARDLYNFWAAGSEPTISRLWVRDAVGAGTNSDIHFDNFSLEAVPEPGTAFFGAVGLLGALARRRRNHRNG